MTQLPSYRHEEDVPNDVSRAGDTEEERRLGQLAWEMVDIWMAPPPHDGVNTDFSTAWLRFSGWQVANTRAPLTVDEYTRFLAAVAARGHRQLLMTFVSPNHPGELTAVWRLPLQERVIGTMLRYSPTMIFTPERDFALLIDGEDIATLAGPPAFLRAALGDLGEVERNFIEEVVEEYEESEKGRVFIQAFRARYAEFQAR